MVIYFYNAPMVKKILSLLILAIISLSVSTTVFATERDAGARCNPGDSCKNNADGNPTSCKPMFNNGKPVIDKDLNTQVHECQQVSAVEKVFGQIQPPAPLAGLLKNDQTGAGGISKFLSNLVALFFSLAAVVLIFMLLWGAFDWMTSEGDKEKLGAAQRKIISAIIGIVLFAITFAVIQILGVFTGFRFFKGQGVTRVNEQGVKFICPDGTRVGGGSDDPDIACRGHGT